MKSHPIRSIVFVLAALAAASLQAQAQERPARIGSTTVTLPTPSGFAAAGADVPELRRLGETMTATSNRLLEIFVSDQDLAAVKGRHEPTLNRYYMAQTLRQAEAQTIEPGDFEKLKKILRTQAQELARKVQPSVQSQLSSAAKDIGNRAGVADVSLRVGEMRMGDVIDETPASISMLAMTKFAVAAKGKSLEVPVTMALTTVLLRGKIVYFYAYSILKSPADTEWVRAQTKAWVPRALAANR